MFGSGFLLWYCILSFIPSSLNLGPNSTSDKRNDYSTEQLNINTAKNYEHEGDLLKSKNFTEINRDMQHGINSTNNNHEDGDKRQFKFREHDGDNFKNNSQTFVESRTNLTDADGTKNFMSQEIHENLKNTEYNDDFTSIDFLETVDRDNNESNSIPYKICDNITCIQLCCPLNYQMINGKCVATNFKKVSMEHLYLYINDSLQIKSKNVDAPLLLIVHDPCQKNGKYLMNFTSNILLMHIFYENGSLNLPYYRTNIEPTSYCLAVSGNEIAVYVCLDIIQNIMNRTKIIFMKDSLPFNTQTVVVVGGHVLVMLFSLLIFLTYSIIPEFHNIHGYILRTYSILTFFPFTIELMILLSDDVGNFFCVASALLRYYCFLGSFCWLNVMSFNMWYTFRQFRATQRNLKKQEKKKLIYSVYGWGVPFVFVIICSIMESVPYTSSKFRPGFINEYCWFHDKEALWLYYSGIVIIFLLISVFLSILTARNISNFEKGITNELKDSKNRRYNDNKQWFKLTIKITKVLFIVIGLKTYIYVILTLYNERTTSIWCTFIMLEVTQHFCIFIIFVWKKNIKYRLVKRFNCRNCCNLSKSRKDNAISLDRSPSTSKEDIFVEDD